MNLILYAYLLTEKINIVRDWKPNKYSATSRIIVICQPSVVYKETKIALGVCYIFKYFWRVKIEENTSK